MVVTALIAVGATLRLQMYLFDKPLWWPEAALALNILRRSGWALLGPYDFHQAAPIGFVLITKAGTLLFGDSEPVLRLPAFIFGLASLPLFYMAARAYLSQAAAMLSLAFFALSPSAIYWASTCKQYSSDLTLAIAALIMGHWLVRNPLTLRRALAAALSGVVGLFFSFPLVFLLTGLAAGLTCDYLVRRDRQALFRLMPVCVAWGVGFAVHYQVSLRTFDVDGFLKIFWAQRFLSLSDWHHSYALVASAFIVPLDLVTVHPWPLIPVCALGLWAIVVRRQALGLFLAVPVVALAIASLFHMYPFWHRMILFVLPLLLLPTCEGVVVIVERARWMWKPLGAAVAVVLVAMLSVRTVEHLLVGPTPFLEIRPMLRHVRDHKRPGDVMYIGEFQPVYEYYKDRLGLTAQPYVVGRYLDKEWSGSDDQVLESLRDSPRVWVLTGDWQVQAGLERFATLVEIMPNDDLTLSLYDPQAQPRTRPPGATVSSGR
jgi:hypothetical protein